MHNSIPAGYKTMTDGEKIIADGIKIRGILAPGHTPGSMCYIVSDTNIVIGDAFALDNGKVQPFNDFFTMDKETHKESIKKLAKLEGIKHIYTGHYGFSHDFKFAFSESK